MLLDSNIVIYAAKQEGGEVRRWIREQVTRVSVITQIEVLGFHGMKTDEQKFLGLFFEVAKVLPLSEQIANEAIKFRQQQRIGLGDSIVAATAKVENLTLATHNTKDFQRITEIRLFDPLSPAS